MLAGRRHVRIDHRGEDHVNVWMLCEVAVLGVIVCALDVVHAWADGNRAAMQDRGVRFSRPIWHCREVRQRGKREIDFARRAACAEVANIF